MDMDQPAKADRPIPESIWLCFSNVCDVGKFKVTLEINGKEYKTFEQYVHQDEGCIAESWNLTWMIAELKAARREKRKGCLITTPS